MNNDLYNKIAEQRIDDPLQLTAAEQELLKSDPEALLAIQENLALKELAGVVPPAPNRDYLLSEATRNQTPTLLPALVTRNWGQVARYAAAGLIVIAAIVLYSIRPVYNGDELEGYSLSPAQPAWASKPGVLMEFDTQTSDEELARAIADSVDAKLKESLASQYFNLQSVHGELAYSRDLLRGHQVYLASIEHEQAASDQLDHDLELKHTQLMQLLEQHGEQLEQAEINTFELKELAEKHVGQLETKLQALSVELASLNHENFKYLRRDISKDEEGNCVITLALPRVAIEFSDVRSRFSELEEIKNVRVENAVFFVREENEVVTESEHSLFGKMEHVHEGQHNVHVSVGHGYDPPHHEIIKAGLKNIIHVSGEAGEYEIEFEGENGHSKVILQREGELIEKLDSGSMGRGLVWYSLPEHGDQFEVHLNSWTHAEDQPTHDSSYREFIVEMNTNVDTDHLGAIFKVGEGEHQELKELQTTISIPGLVSLEELEGKIVSVIGDAPEGKNVEVITETENGVTVLKVMVDGQVIKIMNVDSGDIEVVIAGDKPEKGEPEPDSEDKQK